MKAGFVLLFHIFFLVLLVNSDPEVNIRLGTIKGVQVKTPSGHYVDAFLGIPYAKPPIGPDRFLPPKTIEDPWQDVLVAKNLPNACIQGMKKMADERMNWYLPNSEESEDCLYLNIWVPNPKPEKAAVMVWIHGGGFNGGSSNIEKYDGAILASEEDVVVVTINYRLGIFGFLHLPDTDVSGNMGLFDQVEALKWIQENIAHFGGDKKRVAIFGQSAGGISVAMHLVSSQSKDLFHSAIIQSGPPSIVNKFMDKEFRSKSISEMIKNLQVNCPNESSNQAIIDCLREVKAEALKDQMINAKVVSFFPETDGNFFTNDFQILAQRKHFQKINVMLGTTSDDASTMPLFLQSKTYSLREDYFPNRSDFLMLVKELMPTRDDVVHKTIQSVYTDWQDPNNPLKIREGMINMFTDYLFTCGTNNLARHLTEAGRNVYPYHFSHTPSVSPLPKWMGSDHGDEIDFVFGFPLNPEKGFNQEEVQLSKKMMKYWTNFAKYGNPNGKKTASDSKSDSFQWPKYTAHGKEHITLATRISSGNGIRLRECAFWDNVFPEFLRRSRSNN